jgi:hypothetical protein
LIAPTFTIRPVSAEMRPRRSDARRYTISPEPILRIHWIQVDTGRNRDGDRE